MVSEKRRRWRWHRHRWRRRRRHEADEDRLRFLARRIIMVIHGIQTCTNTHTHTTHRRSRNFLLRIMHSRYSDCFMLLCKNGPTCYLTFIRHLAELRCVVGIADTETPKGQWKSARERARVCARSGKMTRLHSSQFSCHRFASSRRRHRNLFSVVRVGLLYDGECECVRECVCTRGGSDSVKYLG